MEDKQKICWNNMTATGSAWAHAVAECLYWLNQSWFQPPGARPAQHILQSKQKVMSRRAPFYIFAPWSLFGSTDEQIRLNCCRKSCSHLLGWCGRKWGSIKSWPHTGWDCLLLPLGIRASSLFTISRSFHVGGKHKTTWRLTFKKWGQSFTLEFTVVSLDFSY